MFGARTKAALAAVAVAGAVTAAIMLPESQAVAASSGGLTVDLTVQSPAHLIARGAAVGLPVTYTCFGASSVDLFVSVTEHVGNAVATGQAALNAPCGTTDLTVTVDVTAVGSKAFARGSAFATGQAIACGLDGCLNVSDDRTIQIQK